jgi:hypothetical protein
MHTRRVLLTEELYQKLIHAFMGCLNLRQSVVEKTLDNFLTDLLEGVRKPNRPQRDV